MDKVNINSDGWKWCLFENGSPAVRVRECGKDIKGGCQHADEYFTHM